VAVGAQNEDSAAKGINASRTTNPPRKPVRVSVHAYGTTWTQHSYVKSANTRAGDEFGSSLGLSRDGRALLVGARGEDVGSVRDAGAAYLFTR